MKRGWMVVGPRIGWCRGTLPIAPNPLIGRDAEVAELARLLFAPGHRIVTVTGAPGVGKTRLATAVAAAVADRFAHGVVFVDLTTVRDPALVAGEILAVLHVSGGRGASDHLDRALADRDLLVVLDNFEHLLDAGPALAAVLVGSARVRMLVTSRERLHLRAEYEVPLCPLRLPSVGDDVARVAANPAVALLVREVQTFQPGFEVTQENCSALVEICARLDGLPLALELGAARLRLFTPGELTFRLRHRMGTLTSNDRDVPARHRTLRAALTWSHDLLSPSERALFRRFSVFVGGANSAAVEEVCAGGDVDTVATLASLVDKSLLQRRTPPGETAGFVMLESLREFAAERLAECGEQERTQARHARYHADLAARIEGRIGTTAEMSSVAEVAVERGNLRVALGVAGAAGQVTVALHLASALGWYSYTRGRLGEGTATTETAIAAADRAAGPAPDGALAAVLVIAGAVALARGDLDRAGCLLRRCLAITERTGDDRRTAMGSAFLGHLAGARGDYDRALAHHERASALHERLANAHGVAWSGYDLGLLARRRGELDRAAGHLRDALPHFRESGYAWAIGCTAGELATVELRRSHPGEAGALLGEALDGYAAIGDGRGLAQCLETAAAVAARERCHREAAWLLGAADALRERFAAPLPAEEHHDRVAALRRIDRDLGPDAADRARCVGRRLPFAEVLGLARRVAAVPAVPSAVSPARAGLTVREQQVAGLIARGRTNRQIGRTLGIAEKTAETHVHNIIRKLDARSRAEVAAWVGAGGRS